MIRQTKKGLKSLYRMLVRLPPIASVASRYVGEVVCLNYHSVSDSNPHRVCPLNSSLIVASDCFDQQMRFLAENYRCLSLSQALVQLESGSDERSVVVTFDDGFKDNLEVALPILERYQIPATIFVCAGLVENSSSLWWLDVEAIIAARESLHFSHGSNLWRLPCGTPRQKAQACKKLNQYFKSLNTVQQRELLDIIGASEATGYKMNQEIMTWNQLKQMASHPLITIGSHGVSHAVLRNCDEDQLRHEMEGSKSILEDQLGCIIDQFAYPFGLYSHASVREFSAAKKAGYSCALTMRPGYWQKEHLEYRWCLPRIFIDREDDLDVFKEKVAGTLASQVQRFRRVITD